MIHTIRHFELLPISASIACLRGVSGIHLDHTTAGTFCLACQKIKELSPCHIANVSVNAAKVFFLHVVDGKVFNGNGIEPINYFTGFLMSKIFTLPTGSFVNTGNHLSGFSSEFRTFSLFRKFSLSFGKILLFMFEKSRVLNFSSIGEGDEGCKPHVNSNNRLNGFNARGMVDDTGKSYIPFAGWRSANRTSFDLSLNWPVKFDLDTANFGETDNIFKQFESSLRIGERVISKLSTESWEARFAAAGFYTPEKCPESKINSGGNILKRLAKSIVQKVVLFFKYRNCFGLLISGKTFLFRLPGCFALFKKVVVQPATSIKAFLKLFSLGYIWKDTIFESFSHINYTISTNLHNVKKILC